MCTYLLVFYLSRFSGLTVPQNPYWRAKWFGKSGFSVIHILIGCKVTVRKCHNMAHVSRFTATELSQSAIIIWTIILLTTWHKNCLNSALSVTGDILTAFDLSWQLRYIEVTSMDMLHTLVLNYQEDELLYVSVNVVTTSLLRPWHTF